MVNKKKRKIEINIKLQNISDVISFANNLDYNRKYFFDKNLLRNIIPVLEKINSLIGMHTLKESVFNQILLTLQNLHSIDDNFNTIIYGSPGTGKTTISLLLAELYYKIGLVKSSKIYNINKSDLVGQFCGSTVQKTQELLDKVDEEGAVLFIDEVYCLGFGDKTDLFSKEAIDVICKNLLLKKNMICIISGYKEDIQNNFLDINKGLERRFTYKYEIEKYTKKELFDILLYKLSLLNLEVNTNDLQVSVLNTVNLKNNAGDIDILVQLTKMAFSKRVFGKCPKKKVIIKEDVDSAISQFTNKIHIKFDYFL